LLLLDSQRPTPTNWFEVLKSPQGPSVLTESAEVEPFDITKIVGIQILSGGRKALFINAFLYHHIKSSTKEIMTEVVDSKWEEDKYKSVYQMSGLSPALKVGVGSLDLKPRRAKIATDVSIKIDGQQIHRNKSGSVGDIKDQIIETFSKGRTVGVKSQVAGLVSANSEAIGVVINPSRMFTVSKISSDEVVSYIDSLDETLLRRSPGSILWPHPIFESHITSINGVNRENDKFPNEYVDLLQHLLGVPSALGLLIYSLDSQIDTQHNIEANLYSKLNLIDEGLIGESEKLEGSWQELVKDKNGNWLVLRNAIPADYAQMSEIAIRNFRQAPNYAYLQTPEGSIQLEKYIAANTPEGIKDLCTKPNNVCNLVVEKDGKILGFRVIRKNDDVADGRRMHTSLDETDRGIGKILLSKSEKMAKQAGCSTMEVHATGSSYAWFERNGFKNHGVRTNTISIYYLMIKEL